MANLEDSVLDELITIKRLLTLGLLKSGASQGEIAKALGVNQSQISRMFPKAPSARKVKGRK